MRFSLSFGLDFGSTSANTVLIDSPLRVEEIHCDGSQRHPFCILERVLRAPLKGFYTFARSAHSPAHEEP